MPRSTRSSTAAQQFANQVVSMRGALGLVAVWLALCVSLPSRAGAQGPSVGPDVIVGDLQGLHHWGQVGGVQAYSVGTTSCNKGDAPLAWIAGNAHHPVIAQQLYRYENGRFEQLGSSWLKHGFLALQDNLCGYGCQPAPTSSQLGPGCSDPYSAFLNGNQNLGPRSEVDPTTGTFPYPYLLDPPLADLTSRRLRVHADELDPAQHPNALYFVEGHYVAQDDALAGNHHNNASYRRVQVGPSFELSLVPGQATVRERAAIEAWPLLDPDVLLTELIVDGGRFLLGARAEDLGNGLWQYEYALYNMNSHRGAGSFTVPVPVGVAAQGFGFRDVELHSGELQDSTDWGVTQGADHVSWETTPHAVDPQANALRWGTLYNFRMQAGAPPAPALATLGLFRPGTPAAVVIQTLAPVPSGATTRPVQGLACGVSTFDATLSWNPGGVYDAVLVFRNGQPVASLPGTQTLFLDAGLAPGTYDYLVNGVRLGVASPGAACNVSVAAPAAVTQLACGVNGDAVQLSWVNGGGFDSVIVERGSQVVAQLPGTASSHLDLGVVPGTYRYVVQGLVQSVSGAADTCDVQVLPPPPLGFALGLLSPPAFYDLATGIGGGQARVTLGEPPGNPGAPHTVLGLAVALTHDASLIAPLDVTPIGPLAALHAGQGPEFFATELLADGVTVGVVFSFQGTGLTFGPPAAVLEIDYETVAPALAGSATGATAALAFADGVLGHPPVMNTVVVGIHTHAPALAVGALSLAPLGSGQFVRGDANRSGAVDLADAIATLAYLFNGAPAWCSSALDANDDGALNIGDPIRTLGYLFTSGPAPAAPFPGCGVDPTLDALDCLGLIPACP